MADLKDVLAQYDAVIEAAEADAERMLRTHGATDEEIRVWRQTELAQWKTEANWHRQQTVKIWLAGHNGGSLH